MSPWNTADISQIEAFADVGTPSGEIETVFHLDDFGPLFGSDQDADILYDSTIGQLILGVPADVSSNEPILNIIAHTAGVTPTADPATPLDAVHPTVAIWDSGVTDVIAFYNDDTLSHILSEVSGGVEVDIGLWLGDATGDQAKLRIYGYDETATAAAYYTIGTHDDGNDLLSLQIGLLTTTAATENLVICARDDTPAINVEPLNTIAHPKISIWGATAGVGDFLVIYNDDTDSWIRTGAGGIFFDAIAAGDGVDIRFYPEGTNIIDIGADVFETGTFIKIGYDTAETSSGALTIIEFTNDAALTLGADLTGIDINFSSNLTPITDHDIIGFDLITPAFTQVAANITTYTGFQHTSGGAIIQTTAAGTINWYCIDVSPPQALTDTAVAATVNLVGFRLATAGSLEPQAVGNIINWTGAEIQLPVMTETAGTLTVVGVDIDAGTVNSGTCYGIDIDMEAAFTAAQIGIIVDGDARQLQVCNTDEALLIQPTAAGAGVDIAIDPLAAGANVIDIGADVFPVGTFITVGYDTIETSSGTVTVFHVTNAAALTLGGDLMGINIDFNANVGTVTDHDVTSFQTLLPTLTQQAANITTYAAFNIPTAGALVQDTAAGTINWYGINMVAPQMTTDTALVSVINTSMFRVATAAAILTQAAGNIATWNGLELQLPNITETAGTITVKGVDIDSGTVTTGGSVYGIDITMAGAYTTGNEYGIFITGDARQVEICNTNEGILISPDTAASGVDIAIDPLAAGANVIDIGADVFETGTFITVGYDTIETSSGVLAVLHFTNAAALTLGADLMGVNIDFNANVTTVTDHDVIAFQSLMPALTQQAANTTVYKGFHLLTAGALVQDTAAGTINWSAFETAMPQISTDTALVATVNAYGFYIDTAGAITTAAAGNIANWYGTAINTPAPTQTAGTLTVYGHFLQTGAYTSGTVYFERFLDSASAVMFEFISRSATITHPTMRIYDSGGTDFIQFYDDDTYSWIVGNPNAINVAPSNDVDNYIRFSTNTNVPGFASIAADMDIQNLAGTLGVIYDVTFFANQADPATAVLAAGSVPEIRIYGWDHADTALNQVILRVISVEEGIDPTDDETTYFNIAIDQSSSRMMIITDDSSAIPEITVAASHPTLRIYDSGNTDFIQFYDDDAASWIVANPNAINIAPSNDVDDYIQFTTQTNVPGFTTIGDADLSIQNQAAANPFDVIFFASQTVPAATPAAGSTPEIRIYGWSSATINVQVYSAIWTGAVPEGHAETTTELGVMWINPANNYLILANQGAAALMPEFAAAATHATLRIYDSGWTDFIQFYDDDAVSYIETNANPIYLIPDTGVVRFRDADDTDNTLYLEISTPLDGTYVQLLESGNSLMTQMLIIGFVDSRPTISGTHGAEIHGFTGVAAGAAGKGRLTTGAGTISYCTVTGATDETNHLTIGFDVPDLAIDTGTAADFTIEIEFDPAADGDKFDVALLDSVYGFIGTQTITASGAGKQWSTVFNVGALTDTGTIVKGDSLLLYITKCTDSARTGAANCDFYRVRMRNTVGIEIDTA